MLCVEDKLLCIHGKDNMSEKAPIHLYENETKLGLALWSIGPMMAYGSIIFHEKLKKLRPLFSLQLKTIKNKQKEDLIELYKMTNVMLCANADNYTAWNIRKHFMKMGLISYEKELDFLNLILSKHPKSEESFQHRKYIFRTYLLPSIHFKKNQGIPAQLKDEINCCTIAAERYKRNYYAWDYKHIIIGTLIGINLDMTQLFQEALNHLGKHVSDSSSAMFIHFFLKKSLYNAKKANLKGLYFDIMRGIVHCNRLISYYPGHEALWNHRKACIQLLTIEWKLRLKYLKLTTNQVLTKKEQETKFLQFCDEFSIEDYQWPPSLVTESTFVINATEDEDIENFEDQRKHGLHYLLWYVTFIEPHELLQRKIACSLSSDDPIANIKVNL